DEAAGGVGVVHAVVGAGTVAVIPPDHRAMHLTGDRQRHLAVAFARRRRLELGNPLFQVCTAAAAEIGRSGRANAHNEPESGGDGEATARSHQCPVHIHLQSCIALMQEAARTGPAPAPCPNHDACAHICAGAENRTRNALRNGTRKGGTRYAAQLPKRSAGLASCCSAPAHRNPRALVALNGDGRSDLKNALPYDSTASRSRLVEYSMNCK